MSPDFVFYIHHHGSGHLMRALSIASHLKEARITFLGSGLARYQRLIPQHIQCIQLPSDVPGPEDTFASALPLEFLHYVPINVKTVAARSAAISATLHALFPCILIVDVSVEVTLLATLCGTPTVVVRQNGDRDDSAHLHAYACAQLLIAPSPEQLMNVSEHAWVHEKTFFSGGFSKYSGFDKIAESEDPRSVAVMVGSGGTSLNADVIKTLATQCADKIIHVIGEISGAEKMNAENVIFYGQLDEPVSVLARCGMVVGNAGHNTVMEMADLGKKFICIPEERPFQEQLRKAELLAEKKMAIVIQPADLHVVDWKSIIQNAENLSENSWDQVTDQSALTSVADRLYALWESNFPSE